VGSVLLAELTRCVNHRRYDQTIATKALLGLIATLQAAPLNFDIARATVIACDLLFGMGEAAVQEQELDWEEVGKFAGAVVQWQPPTAGSDGKFTVRLPGAERADAAPLLRALKNLAGFAVKQDLDINNMRQLIRPLRPPATKAIPWSAPNKGGNPSSTSPECWSIILSS
jgi:hypothetical protein